jgi:Transposase DDE domain
MLSDPRQPQETTLQLTSDTGSDRSRCRVARGRAGPASPVVQVAASVTPCRHDTGPTVLHQHRNVHADASAASLDTLTPVAGLPERPVLHLDAGYDYQTCRQVLAERGMAGEIATRGKPAPIQASRRWPVERTHAWGNQYGKLRWCTERRRVVVEFWLALAAAAIVCGRLLRRAWSCYRWEGRPRRHP